MENFFVSTLSDFVPAEYKWLNLRKTYDNDARNKVLQNKLLKKINSYQLVNILDLGAGSGANYEYFEPLIKVPKTWTLIDRDRNLLDCIIARYKNICSTNIVCDDFLNKKCEIYQQQYDLILANAVFDILSVSQFDCFLKNLSVSNSLKDTTIFYFTLNITKNYRFCPAIEDDQYITDLFLKHMKRSQYYGSHMGSDCVSSVQNVFIKNNYTKIELGKSIWVINPENQDMLRSNLEFFEFSCLEIEKPENHNKIKRWLSVRKKQIISRQLSLEVTHYDILVNF